MAVASEGPAHPGRGRLSVPVDWASRGSFLSLRQSRCPGSSSRFPDASPQRADRLPLGSERELQEGLSQARSRWTAQVGSGSDPLRPVMHSIVIDTTWTAGTTSPGVGGAGSCEDVPPLRGPHVWRPAAGARHRGDGPRAPKYPATDYFTPVDDAPSPGPPASPRNANLPLSSAHAGPRERIKCPLRLWFILSFFLSCWSHTEIHVLSRLHSEFKAAN